MQTSIAGYQILRELGRGGMGVVLEGREPSSGRRVAIKLLNPEAIENAKALERFHREAQALARLRHPYVVQIHSFGTHLEQPYFVQEFAEGQPLEEVYERQRPLQERWVAGLIAKLASAVQAAHDAGILHRDLKPANVVCRPNGDPVLLDFGIVRSLEDTEEQRLSRTGAGVGTPGYWSPEQACGERERLGPASDLYSLGAVLYYLLTGRPPIQSVGGVASNVLLTVAEPPTPPTLLRSDLSLDLEQICLRCLEKEPEDRYASALDLKADLEAFLAGRPLQGRSRRRVGWILAPLALAAIAAAIGVWRLRPSELTPKDALKPTLSLAPVDAKAPHFHDSLTLAGSVEAGGEWVEVSATGVPPRRLRPGSFELKVPLVTEGKNEITLSVASSSGASVTTTVTVTYRRVPAWFADLKSDSRPWPLPAQLRIGETSGEYVNSVDRSKLVYIPPTTYRRGREEEADDSSGSRMGLRFPRSDQPAHSVTLSGYFLGKYEVSWAQFEAFAEASDHLQWVRTAKATSKLQSSPDLPVWGVSWEEAVAYCAWAGLRLPTEAEWELGARGPNPLSRYPWGDRDPVPGDANYYGDLDGASGPSAGGHFPDDLSRFGCFDMAGNMTEWVSDYLAPYQAAPLSNPLGPSSSRYYFMPLRGWREIPDGIERLRVVRGAPWTTRTGAAPGTDPYSPGARDYESSERFAGGLRADGRGQIGGFRVCLGE